MMESRFGVKGLSHRDIFFTEDRIPSATPIKHLQVEISRQNSHLNEVKDQLASQAAVIGATAIMNFRYGQKKHEWWELIFTFKWDTESWHGEGDAIRI
jgi:hypothetical protein